METATEVCPCGEKVGGDKWHYRRSEDTCAGAKAARKLYDRDRNKKLGPRQRRTGKKMLRAPRWIPGTDIEIPEIDPL